MFMEYYGEPLLAQFQLFASKSQLSRMLIALAVMLFIVAIAIELLRRRSVVQGNIASSKRDFELLAARKGLTRQEIRQMYDLAKRARVASPFPLATSALRFDEAIDAELARLKRTADEGDSIAQIYSAIRQKLGLNEIPLGHALPSSRFLSAGQQLVVGKADARSEPGYPAEIIALDDAGITVSWPARGDKKADVHVDDRLRVAMWRANDARYFFDTDVKNALSEMEPRLVLRHTRDITRVQSRKFYRVEVSIPVVLHYVPGERAVSETSVDMPVGAVSRVRRFSARLTTLSGGGMSMVCDQNIPVDSVLRSHIPLEGIGAPAPVACRVLNASTSRRAGKYVLRAQFVAIDEEDRDRLFRYVSLKQQERITEMA